MRASPLFGALTVTLALGVASAQTRSPALDALRRGRSVAARVRAAQSVARLHPDGAREALERALDDRAAAVRAAAAEGLVTLSDARALPALERHQSDRNPAARAALTSAARDLRARAGATTPAPSSAHAEAPHTPRRVDWRRVRVVVGVGPLTNRTGAGADGDHLDHLRAALRDELSSHDALQLHPGALPAVASARLRNGQLRSYTIEGGITTLRAVDAPGSVGARAEVSLLLISLPQRAIVGTLSGAALAQEQLYAHSGPDALRSALNRRAIEAAAQGALRELERTLASRR